MSGIACVHFISVMMSVQVFYPDKFKESGALAKVFDVDSTQLNVRYSGIFHLRDLRHYYLHRFVIICSSNILCYVCRMAY